MRVDAPSSQVTEQRTRTRYDPDWSRYSVCRGSLAPKRASRRLERIGRSPPTVLGWRRSGLLFGRHVLAAGEAQDLWLAGAVVGPARPSPVCAAQPGGIDC